MARQLTVAAVLSALLAGCGGTATAPVASTPGELRYAVIGDSYSNGEGNAPEAAWPVQLAERLAGDGLRVRVVANPSVTGWTSRQAIDAELDEVAAADPDVITVLIGVNDLVQRVPVDAFSTNLRRILDFAVEQTGSPGDVVAVTIPDFTQTPVGASFGPQPVIQDQLEVFNAVIAREARSRGIAVADIYATSQEPGDGLVAPDGLHPSAAELGRWTDVITPVASRAWARP